MQHKKLTLTVFVTRSKRLAQLTACAYSDCLINTNIGRSDLGEAVDSTVMPLLQVEDLMVRFGGIVALDRVSFDIQPKQICGLIGPNGAGKTTLFNCLSRLYTPQTGQIRFNGKSLLDRPPAAVIELGIG